VTIVQELLALFALLTLADIGTTYLFPRYGITEANSWLASLMGRNGFDELYLVKWIVFLGVFVAAGQGVIGWIEMSVACAVQGGVVAWNGYQIWRKRNG
jgi:hypothetical protein